MRWLFIIYSFFCIACFAITPVAWHYLNRDWGMFSLGIGIGAIVGLLGNLVASGLTENLAETALRRQYVPYTGEYDAYAIRNAIPTEKPIGSATVKYFRGGSLQIIYTDNRGDSWTGEARFDGQNGAEMRWRYVLRHGDITQHQHRIGKKDVQIDVIVDSTKEILNVIYLQGLPKPEYGDEILVPVGRSLDRSALVPRIRRPIRTFSEMAGQSPPERPDPEMG